MTRDLQTIYAELLELQQRQAAECERLRGEIELKDLEICRLNMAANKAARAAGGDSWQ